MKKMRLNLDEIAVDSFEVDGQHGNGTVVAQSGYESGCGPCETDRCPASGEYTCLKFTVCWFSCTGMGGACCSPG